MKGEGRRVKVEGRRVKVEESLCKKQPERYGPLRLFLHLFMGFCYSDYDLLLNNLDGGCFGFDGLAVCVGDFAVELHAVPLGIDFHGLGGGCVTFPDVPLALTLFHVIPLVFQSVALRRYRKFQRLAVGDCLALGLRSNFQRDFHLDGDGLGVDGIAVAVSDLAIELNAVPCGVRGGCLGAADSALPLAE